jgi:hypothetical protein
MIECRIQGIPCLVEVDYFAAVKGSFRYDEISDLDYHGYVECEYTVYDRKGYPAKWLEAKITAEDDNAICDAIAEELS